MARLGNKHPNAEKIVYGDFSGGLQLTKAAEALETNEMQVCENFEFDQSTGALKLRGGLVIIANLPGIIKDLIPVPGADAVLCRCADNKVYRVEQYVVSSSLGTIEGEGPVSYALWGETNELLICAGGKLYKYAASVLTKIDASPEKCDFVFVRVGRVVTVDRSTDTLRYSGVGDPTNWNFAGNDGDAQELEVGYKDGWDLVAVAPLTSDLIVFKAPQGEPGQGRIYRVINEYPEWIVKQHSTGSSAWGHRTVSTSTADVIFVTSEGVASLGTVTDYGDIKLAWAGQKVNPRLSAELTDDCRLWKLSRKSQIWIRTKSAERIWVYSYTIGRGGVWTTFKFPNVLNDVCETGKYTYVAIQEQLFRIDDMYGTDNGNPFVGRIKFQSIIKSQMTLLKQVLIGYTSMADTKAELIVQGHKINLPLGGQLSDIAFLDPDIAYLDDSYLLQPLYSIVRNRLNIRTWDATAEILITEGPFGLNLVGLEIAEV